MGELKKQQPPMTIDEQVEGGEEIVIRLIPQGTDSAFEMIKDYFEIVM